MICRARPKYFAGIDSGELIDDEQIAGYCAEYVEDALFFNAGSVGFEFFLRCYNSFYHKNAKVGIQSFTCRTMLDAVIRSGSIAYIYDIKLEDVSLSIHDVENDDLDVLVITNYQGVPNHEYKKFLELCEEKNIVLFDDLTHGADSMVEGIKLGTLSSAYIESFAFDKPFSVLHGGKLKILHIEDEFREYIYNEYRKMPEEPTQKAVEDIHLLTFLMKYTAPANYYVDFDYSLFCQGSWSVNFWNRRLFTGKYYRQILKFFIKVVSRLTPNQKNQSVLNRLNPIKIQHVVQQYVMYKCCWHGNRDYGKLLGINSLNSFERKDDRIVWNRYSIVDSDGEVLEKLRAKGICAGSYNWPRCLHEYAAQYDHRKIVLKSDFANTEYIKTHIINIPIWQFGA